MAASMLFQEGRSTKKTAQSLWQGAAVKKPFMRACAVREFFEETGVLLQEEQSVCRSNESPKSAAR